MFFLLKCIVFSISFFNANIAKKPENIEINLLFEHHFAGKALTLYTPYTTLNGDKIEFTRFKYYISHIQLKSESGKLWKEAESYHLIELGEENGNTFQLNLKQIDMDNFSEISFSIGIDSLRNSGGKQDGSLDPLKGMFWTWEQGYIFFKAEGYYQKSAEAKGGWVLHIGRNETYRNVSLQIQKGQLKKNKENTYQLIIKVDTQKIFGGFIGAALNLKTPKDDTKMSIMGGPKAPKIADNYAKMFEKGD